VNEALDLSLLGDRFGKLDESGCFFCGATPHQRKTRRGYVGCKVCAPTDFSDSHATMTAIGMAKLSAKSSATVHGPFSSLAEEREYFKHWKG
jgi:hypothetical protein